MGCTLVQDLFVGVLLKATLAEQLQSEGGFLLPVVLSIHTHTHRGETKKADKGIALEKYHPTAENKPNCLVC